MIEQFLQAIMEQLKEPKADLEKNVRALLSEMVSRMDLVSQEDFSRQQHLLLKAQQDMKVLFDQIETLNAKVASLQKISAP